MIIILAKKTFYVEMLLISKENVLEIVDNRILTSYLSFTEKINLQWKLPSINFFHKKIIKSDVKDYWKKINTEIL